MPWPVSTRRAPKSQEGGRSAIGPARTLVQRFPSPPSDGPDFGVRFAVWGARRPRESAMHATATFSQSTLPPEDFERLLGLLFCEDFARPEGGAA